MRCGMRGCGYTHYDDGGKRKVYAIGYKGFSPIILCDKCIKQMSALVKDDQAERAPRINSKTGEVINAKKPQTTRKKVESNGE